jgi:hypothetical protein
MAALLDTGLYPAKEGWWPQDPFCVPEQKDRSVFLVLFVQHHRYRRIGRSIPEVLYIPV